MCLCARSRAESHEKPNCKIDFEHVRIDDGKCKLPFITNTCKIKTGDIILLPAKVNKRKAEDAGCK